MKDQSIRHNIVYYRYDETKNKVYIDIIDIITYTTIKRITNIQYNIKNYKYVCAVARRVP